jgi:hypothetical protein
MKNFNASGYIHHVGRAVQDAITHATLSAAIKDTKEKLERGIIRERVSNTAYSAACSIAENVSYVRTAHYTASWLTAKLPDVEKRAYEAALSAARVIHDIDYCDERVLSHMAAALIKEVAARANPASHEESVNAAIDAVSNPKDQYCATQVIAREAAQSVFKDEDDVTRAAVTMFESVKVLYDRVSEMARKNDLADDPFIRRFVFGEARKFAQELAALNSSHDNTELAELDLLCESIAISQAVVSADRIHRSAKAFTNAARRIASGGFLDRAYLALWFGPLTVDETWTTNKLIKEALRKDQAQLAPEAEAGLQYLRSKRQIFAPPKEVQEAIRILCEIEAMQLSSTAGFAQVRKFIENYLASEPADFIAKVQTIPVRQLIYTFVMNTAADLVESGKYHIYRGAVVGLGQDFITIFNWGQDELLKMGATDDETVKQSREAFKRNLQSVG